MKTRVKAENSNKSSKSGFKKWLSAEGKNENENENDFESVSTLDSQDSQENFYSQDESQSSGQMGSHSTRTVLHEKKNESCGQDQLSVKASSSVSKQAVDHDKVVITADKLHQPQLGMTSVAINTLSENCTTDEDNSSVNYLTAAEQTTPTRENRVAQSEQTNRMKNNDDESLNIDGALS